MDNRTCIDRQTYLIILRNQRDYYTRIGASDIDRRARQAVAAAFVCDEAIEDEAFQKDHDDARRDNDWAPN